MKCPWCQSPLDDDTALKISLALKLTPRNQAIFREILNNGTDGLSLADIKQRFGIKSPITVRTLIHKINKQIHPMVLSVKAHRVRVWRRANPRNTSGLTQ